MSRSPILASLAAASLGIVLLGACSAESLAERAVEVGLEQAAEGGQDIDLNFDNDGSGGFSILTEDGNFAIDIDEEAGSIAFNTEDGDGVINFDEDDGTLTVTTDDGDFGIVSGAEIPDNWPSIIGVPTTLVPGSQTFSVVEIASLATALTGNFEHATGDPFGQEVVARLKAGGWAGDAAPSSDGGLSAMMRKDGATIQIIADPNFAHVTYTQPIN